VAASGPASGVALAAPTAAQQQELKNLQISAKDEINRRIGHLNDVSSLLDNDSKLLSKIDETIKHKVDDRGEKLVQLKKKLSQESSYPAAQKDVQQLKKDYSRYDLTLQKGFLLASADYQQSLEAKLSKLANKCHARMDTAASEGTDTSSQLITLNDLQSNLESADSATKTVVTKVPPIKHGTYQANRSVLISYYEQLQNATHNMQQAFADAQQLVAAIQKY
jgi:chromosome segregation ATPase